MKEYLDSLKVRTFTCSGMITDVGILMEESGNSTLWCKRFIDRFLGLEVEFDNDIEARIFTKSLLVNMFKSNFSYGEEVLELATEYTNNFIANPFWSFLRSVDEVEVSNKVIGDSTVLLKPNGKIKKGGKQIIAAELFEKHILNQPEPMSNKDFKALLIKELDMTILGASTYLNILRTKNGMVVKRK